MGHVVFLLPQVQYGLPQHSPGQVGKEGRTYGQGRAWAKVQFSHSVVSDSLQPHAPQHARPPCPSPTPGGYPNSCLVSRWCPPTISSSVVPFSSCPQSFPASRSFQMSPLFTSSGQSIAVSASALTSPSNEHPGLISFRMDWLDLLAAQGTLKSLLQHHSSRASILLCSAFFIVLLSHPYMTTGKTIALTRWTFAGKVMSLLFNMLSRLATHSSILAWRIPGMGEPGGLPSMGLHRIGHNWRDLAAAAGWLQLFFQEGSIF